MEELEKAFEHKRAMTDSGEKRRKPDSAALDPPLKKKAAVVEEEEESFIRTNSADSDSIKKSSSPSPQSISSNSGHKAKSPVLTATKSEKGDARPLCKYDTQCYRKNPDHFKEFRHSNRDD